MREQKPAQGHQRVVIVGGGFGGLACARALDGAPVEVLLLDRRNYHLFTPLLYQVATAMLDPSDITYPLRAAFRRSGNVRFRQAAVTDIDLERRVVRTDAGEEIPYDRLVLATGSDNAYFGNAALAEHTIGMKTLGQAMRLRNHVLSCLEEAARASLPERAAWLTFVIVGGGPTGVEYAGALTELLQLVLGDDFPELPPGSARVVLVEGVDRLLPAFHPALGDYAARVLGHRGVEVRTSTLISAATDRDVTTSTGEEIPTRTVVWSAGVAPAGPLRDTGLARSRSHRFEVDGHLRLPQHPDVFVIGDFASVAAGDGEVPMLAAPAIQAGRHVGRVIRRGEPGAASGLRPFRYRSRGVMATIGRRAAVAQLGRVRMTGFAGWVVWLAVHLYYLIGFRNRLAVLGSWGWDYLRHDRPIRSILRSDQEDRVIAEVDGGR